MCGPWSWSTTFSECFRDIARFPLRISDLVFVLAEGGWSPIILGRAGIVGTLLEYLEELEEVGSCQELLSCSTSGVATPVFVVSAVENSEGEVFDIVARLLFVG